MSPEDKSQNRPVDGSPRTVAIYVGSEGLSHICVGETRPAWFRRSFLQRWSPDVRELRLSGAVKDRIEKVHKQFHEKVKQVEDDKTVGLNRAQSLVQVGSSPGSLVDLESHITQSIDGATMTQKDRCVQCRKTFGFRWALLESPLDGDTVVKWAKAEQPGKCAGTWLWQTCVRMTDAAVQELP